MLKAFCARKLRKPFRHLIYTPDGVYYPDIVSDSDLSVFSDISHKGELGIKLNNIIIAWRVRILNIIRQGRFHIMRMHVLACSDIGCRKSYHITVFDDIIPVFYITQGIFMTVIKVYFYVIKLIYDHFFIHPSIASASPGTSLSISSPQSFVSASIVLTSPARIRFIASGSSFGISVR